MIQSNTFNDRRFRPIYLRRFAALLFILVWGLPTSVQAAAEGVNTRKVHKQQVKACEIIPVAVPEFKCDDGFEVPKAIDANQLCEKPENLYARCAFQSTLGQLKKDNKEGVQIYYSCRKEPDGGKHYRDDSSGTYFDIAVIQHDPKTGNTCFYQRLGDYPGNKTIPAPAKDNAKFWNVKPNFCTVCHTNGPFIRTPHYNRVLDKSNTIVKTLPSSAKPEDYLKVRGGYIKLLDTLPAIQRPPEQRDEFGDIIEFDENAALAKQKKTYLKIKNKYVKSHNLLPDIGKRLGGQYKYKVLHEQPAVWEVSRGEDGCDHCHTMGAYQTTRNLNAKMKNSKLNQLAAAHIMSLREKNVSRCYSKLKNGKCPSPTHDGYHDFMQNPSTGYAIPRETLVKALKNIEPCFKQKKDRPDDCKFRDPSK